MNNEMITTDGEKVTQITAEMAALVSDHARENYTAADHVKADIMQMIERKMRVGQESIWYRPPPGVQLDRSTIKYLVGLGYLVWHHEPLLMSEMKPLEYNYTIFWRFPDGVELADGVKPFAPGERYWDQREQKEQPGESTPPET